MIKYRYPTRIRNGDQVAVYRNLTTKSYSIMALKGDFKGKVIAHADTVRLKNVTTKISEAGRQRVIRTGVKNVHAFVIGNFLRDKIYDFDTASYYHVTYNPEKRPTFYYKTTNKEFHSAEEAVLHSKGMLTK